MKVSKFISKIMGKSQSKLKQKQLDRLQGETKFSREELQDLYTVFQKHCPKGVLTVGKFKNLYASFFPDGDSDSFAECVYRSMDKNLDGKVDFQEFTHMLSVSKKGTPEERMRMAFTMCDVDKNGEISRSEMLEIVSAIYKLIGARVDFPDDEQTPQMRVDKIFNNMDKDLDGKLSLEEFLEGAKHDKHLWVH